MRFTVHCITISISRDGIYGEGEEVIVKISMWGRVIPHIIIFVGSVSIKQGEVKRAKDSPANQS